jgi:hypothetical protein
MSQEAVERVLGRLVTDERFRTRAFDSLEAASLQEGYLLTKVEQHLLSGLKLHAITEFAIQLDPGLCRARSVAK